MTCFFWQNNEGNLREVGGKFPYLRWEEHCFWSVGPCKCRFSFFASRKWPNRYCRQTYLKDKKKWIIHFLISHSKCTWTVYVKHIYILFVFNRLRACNYVSTAIYYFCYFFFFIIKLHVTEYWYLSIWGMSLQKRYLL